MGASSGNNPKTVPELLSRSLAAQSSGPLLTWYDDSTGERVELTGATLDNWVAKTANLLVDGCALGPGDRASVLLPAHWQTAAVLLGCWSAGLMVAEPAERAVPVDVLFVTAQQAAAPEPGSELPAAGERFALGLAPLGAPLRAVPAGFTDYILEVRGQGDRFVPYQVIQPDHPARPGRPHQALCDAAAVRARALGVQPGARVLIDVAAHPDPLDWLLAPLTAGASTVLCKGADAAGLRSRVAAERVTVTLTGSPG